MWAEDRLHLFGEGHRRVALHAFSVLGPTPEGTDWAEPLPAAASLPRRVAVRGHVEWTRDHLGQGVVRRLRGRSSGDLLQPKRTVLGPVRQPD